MSETIDLSDHRILRGRLALALVSARARQCPLKTCGRKGGGSCRARFGGPGDNVHQPEPPCPVMSAAEWEAVGLALQMIRLRLIPWFNARAAARAAAEAQLSSRERELRQELCEEVGKQRAAGRPRLELPGFPLGELLWQAPGALGLTLPADLPAAGRQLVETMRADGCRCAAARQISPACADGCAPGCLQTSTGAPSSPLWGEAESELQLGAG